MTFEIFILLVVLFVIVSALIALVFSIRLYNRFKRGSEFDRQMSELQNEIDAMRNELAKRFLPVVQEFGVSVKEINETLKDA